jgi:predicted MFS family arabinose efflux permease
LLRRVGQLDRIEKGARLDVLGAILCALGLAGPVYGLIEQPSLGWASVTVLLPLALGGLFLVSFIWREAHTQQPMLPLSLFRIRNFSFGNAATLAIYAGLTGATFLITISLQQIGGYSPLAASMATLPVSVVMFLLSSRFGKLAGRYGPRLFMTLGPITAACGFLLMLRVQPHVRYVADLLPGVLVFALGLSTTVAPLTAAVLGDIEAKRAGIASAVNNAVARIAGLIAVASVGVITGAQLNIHGFHRALVATAVLLAAGGVVSFIGIRNREQRA